MWSDNGGGNYSSAQKLLVKNYIIDRAEQHDGPGRDARIKEGRKINP